MYAIWRFLYLMNYLLIAWKENEREVVDNYPKSDANKIKCLWFIEWMNAW